MEDTPDKIRRNLVMFSATIIIGWFLELKLTDTTKSFVLGDLSHVNMTKLWIVVLAILVYFILRYRFDDTTNAQLISLSEELRGKRRKYLYEYLRKQINKINQSQEPRPIFESSLFERINKQKIEYEKEFNQRVSWKLYATTFPWREKISMENAGDILGIEKADDIWNGQINIGEEYAKDGQNSRTIATHSGGTYDYAVPSSGRGWVETFSIMHLISYSKSAVDFLIPVIIAYAALLITVNALTVTWWN